MLPLSYTIIKHKEALIRKIVWRLPKSVVMWAYIRVASHATTGKYSDTVVTDIGMMEALDRWVKK